MSTQTPDRYAVFGNPIEHSKSPLIHHAFAQQTQQHIHYDKQLVPVDGFERAAEDFFQNGGHGLNITVPFKEHAFNWVNQRSPLAERAGAVNTLVWDGQKTIGHNTDGLGLVRDLTHNHNIALKDARILILGAGGAVRGVIEPLLSAQPQCIHIANRTEQKAHDLAELFHADSLHSIRSEQTKPVSNISASGYAQLTNQSFDVIINGTSTGITGELPPLPNGILTNGGCTYDMFYANEATAFVRWGQNNGAAHALDGLGMLVEQAAEAFLLWRGVRPDTHAVMQQLRPDNH